MDLDTGPTGFAPTRPGPADARRSAVARVLLSREVGQRIPPIQELQAQIGAGAGTVMKVLRELEDREAIGLESRGRLGTAITNRHVGRLWEAASLGNLRLSMPPPGPVEQQAISDVITEALTRLGIPVVVEFRGGSRNRLEEVFQERTSVAVTSLSAFRHHQESLGGLIHIDVGRGSYYAADSLVAIERTGRRRRGKIRVGIDGRSYDHELITRAQFGHLDPEYVPCVFYRAPEMVLRGTVDVAVWHQLPTVIPPNLAGLTLRPLDEDMLRTQMPTFSHAALVTRALDAPTNATLREVRLSEILGRQRDLAARTSDDLDGPAFWPR